MVLQTFSAALPLARDNRSRPPRLGTYRAPVASIRGIDATTNFKDSVG